MSNPSETKIYLAKKGKEVIVSADLKTLKDVYGIEKAELVVTEAQYAENDYTARLEDGKIVLGRTQIDKEKRAALERVEKLKRQLEETDYVTLKIVEDPSCKAAYAAVLENRKKWWEEVDGLLKK